MKVKGDKDSSKTRLLDMEITNYEKTVNALNLQLISKDKEIQNLKEEIKLNGTNESHLKDDVQDLEQKVEQANEQCTQLKQQLVLAQKEIQEAKRQESDLLTQDSTLKAQLETVNLQIENYKVFT